VNKCPHCKGELVKEKLGRWDYTCKRCGRGWKIDKHGNWLALFDAGMHVYDKNGKLIANLEKARKFYIEAGLG